jgi:hypothetical protein
LVNQDTASRRAPARRVRTRDREDWFESIHLVKILSIFGIEQAVVASLHGPQEAYVYL